MHRTPSADSPEGFRDCPVSVLVSKFRRYFENAATTRPQNRRLGLEIETLFVDGDGARDVDSITPDLHDLLATLGL